MDMLGKKFLVDFGMAQALLYFDSETEMTFTILAKDGEAVNITETVTVQRVELRPGLFMVTWKERNGNTVTQVQDYVRECVYSNWTEPGGRFINREGTLRPVTGAVI